MVTIKFPNNNNEKLTFVAELKSKEYKKGSSSVYPSHWALSITPLDFDVPGKGTLRVGKLLLEDFNLSGVDENIHDIKVDIVKKGRIIASDDFLGPFIKIWGKVEDGELLGTVGKKGGSKTATAEKIPDDAKMEMESDDFILTSSASSPSSTSTRRVRREVNLKDKFLGEDKNFHNVAEAIRNHNVKEDLLRSFLSEEDAKSFYDKDDCNRYHFKHGRAITWIKNNQANLNGSESTTSTGTTTTTNIATESSGDNTNNKTPPKNQSSNLSSLKNQVISAINSALNQDPKLTDADLDSVHQGWKTKLNNLNEESDIKLLKDNVISHINSKRKSKQDDANITSNLQKAQAPDATPEDKKNALNEIEKNEGKEAYEKSKDKTTDLKKEVAKNDPDDYRNRVMSKIPTKLENSGVSEGELGQPIQQKIKDLRDKKITEPEKMVEAETEIFREIGQVGVTKKIDNFEKRVKAVLKSKNKTEIEKLKSLLIEFINSNDIHYRSKKEQAEKLLSQLAKQTSSNNPTNSPGINPLKIIIPLGLAGLALVGLTIFMVRRQKQKQTRLAEE